MTRSRRELDTLIASYENQLASLIEERDTLPAIPDEPEAGSVIIFTVQFEKKGVVYKYSAVRVGSTWAVTGRSSRMPWLDVVQIMMKDFAVRDGIVPIMFQLITKTRQVNG